MGRNKVVPTVERHDEEGSDSVRCGGLDLEEEEGSGQGLLVAVNKHVVNEDGEDEGGGEEDGKAPALIKPMMSTVGDIVDEGLGDDFEDKPWVPPTVKRAEDYRAQTIYRAGKSSIWDTRLRELEDMGIGVSLYFQFLKFLGGTYLVLTVLSVPPLLFAISGEGFTEVTVLESLVLTMIGNVGRACEEDAALNEYTSGCNSTVGASQVVLGMEYSELDISYNIAAFEFLSSVFAILAVVYWRWRTNVAVERVDSNKVTATDYAVFIEGLPKTAGRKEIGEFFSDLYQLEAADWKGRPPCEFAQPVFSVENTGDKWYMGKWVAEVCVARKVGREVKAYKDKKDTVLELRRKRAEAKMYNEGTPLDGGAGGDPSKFSKAVNAADKLGERIAKTTDKIMEMRKDINEKQACVAGFIVFNHPLSLHRCMEDFSSMSVLKRYPKELKFQGIHKLKVVKAPEPDNIIWENLEFSQAKRRIRQNLTGIVSIVLLLIAFALVMIATGVQDNWAQIIPKIAYCQREVPALYFSNYSKAIDLADELLLVRPGQGDRPSIDEVCQARLESSVYMVYTLEEGDDSYLSPALNYTMDACGIGEDVCPVAGDDLHCPCIVGGSIQRCDTLECSQPGSDPGGTCGEFVLSTVSGCYCWARLQDERAESKIFSAARNLQAEDSDICLAFATSWIMVKVFNFVISFMTPIINGILERCLVGLVAWQHNTSDDETATRLMFGVFQTQFINTGLLFLLVYGTGPSGYETPDFLKNLSIFSGSYTDFSRDWQKDAGHGLLISYILAGIGPHFWPLIDWLFFSKRRIRKAKKAIQEDKGEYVIQGDLNEVFVGPVFDFTTRYSYLLTMLFVAMAYSGGMFAINALSFLFFLVTYWVDKAMLLRFYRRPPHREDALQRQVNNTLPWALLLHLCFTCWFMGTESLKSEIITESISQVKPYEDVIASYEEKYGILVSRIIRTNVFPLFLLMLGVLVWCLLEFLDGVFPLLAILGKGFRCIIGACTGNKRNVAVMRPGQKFRSRWTSEVAAYTDVYYQYIPQNGDLTTAEKMEGWMVSHLADKSVVRKKGWNMDEEEAPPGRGDAKFSWEVIRDNSCFTYRIDLVPAYAEVMAALQEEERLYKEDLAAESDGSVEESAGEEDGDESKEEKDDGDSDDDEEEDKAALTKSTQGKAKTEKKAAFNPFDEIDELGGDNGGDGGGGDDEYNPFADFMDGTHDD